MEIADSAVPVGAAGDAADRAMRRLAGLLRAGVYATEHVSREWTVRDVAAHVAGLLPVYVGMVRGEPSPLADLNRLAEFNDQLLAVDEQNVYAFADTIDREMAALLEEVAAADGDVPIRWHGGVQLPLSTVLGLVAGEGYVHGYDVARAARTHWEIPPEDAVTVIASILPVTPAMVDESRARDLTGTVELRLRGVEDGRWAFVFRSGALEVERSDGGRADWILSCAPVAYLMAAYGRLSPLKGMLTGQMLGWGPKPAVGLRFARAFRNP